MRGEKMKKNHKEILFCLLIMIGFFILEQATLFANQFVGYYWTDDAFPNFPWSIENSPDNGFIIGAETWSRNGIKMYPPDAIVIRVDSEGKVLWWKQFGTGCGVYPCGITRTSDNSYIIAASGNCIGDSLNAKAWLIKIKDDGTILWQRAYGVNTYCHKAYELFDHSLIIVGGTWELVGEDWINRPQVMKIDEDGNVLWTKILKTGSDYEWLEGSTFISDSEFIAWGRSRLYKFNIDGTLIWQKALAESIGNWIKSLVVTPEGNLIIAAHYDPYDVGGYAEPTILCYSDDGTLKWAKKLPVVDNHFDNSVYLCPLFPKGDGTITSYAFFFSYVAADGNMYWGPGAIQFNEDGKMGQNALFYKTPFLVTSVWSKVATVAADGNIVFSGELCVDPFYSISWDWKNALIKTDGGNLLNGNCTETIEIPLYWEDCDAPCLLKGNDEIESVTTTSFDTTPYNYFYDVVVKSVNTFCPVITQINKLQNPFRLEILGYNFIPPYWGSYIPQVVINDNPVPQTTWKWWKNLNRIIAKKDTALKYMLPKGVPVCVQIRAVDSHNNDIVYPLYQQSDCFYFTR